MTIYLNNIFKSCLMFGTPQEAMKNNIELGCNSPIAKRNTEVFEWATHNANPEMIRTVARLWQQNYGPGLPNDFMRGSHFLHGSSRITFGALRYLPILGKTMFNLNPVDDAHQETYRAARELYLQNRTESDYFIDSAKFLTGTVLGIATVVMPIILAVGLGIAGVKKMFDNN